MTHFATDWRAAAACLSADPDLFFPISKGAVTDRQVTVALRVCAGCAVRQPCLDFAMQTAEANGIWGGTTPEERIRARRKATRRRKEAQAQSWQQTPDVRAS
jgi:WhiB family redox-sensing transcriptional regulator